MKRITLALPSPYVGLRAFEEDDDLLFFGRDAHVSELLAKLATTRFVAVLGASGSGKSSLVRAGLIPGLHSGGLPGIARRWNVYTIRPGDSPLLTLTQELARDERWLGGLDPQSGSLYLRARMAANPLSLVQVFAEMQGLFEDEACLIVVDQFEEIFRYRQRNADEADAFVKLLVRTARAPQARLHVLITMRADFLGNCMAFFGLPEALNAGLYLTPRLTRDQLLSAITSPLSLVGGEIDPVLAAQLVNNLTRDDELPVLQHKLLRMWDHAKACARTRVEFGDLDAVTQRAALPATGRAEQSSTVTTNAIDIHASEVWRALPSDLHRNIAEQVFVLLTDRRDGHDVRHPCRFSELVRTVGEDRRDALTTVLDAYRATGVGFLVPPVDTALSDEVVVDISHESLIRQWELLQRWLAEEEIDAAELAEWWQRTQRRQSAAGDLLSLADVARAQAWLDRLARKRRGPGWAGRYGGATAPSLDSIRRFVRDSRDELDRRQRRRSRLAIATIVAALFTAAGFAWLWRAAVSLKQAAQSAALTAVERSNDLLAALEQVKQSRQRVEAEKAKADQATVAAQADERRARASEDAARFSGRHATALRLLSEAQAMLSGVRSEGDERALLQILAAHRLVPEAAVEDGVLNALVRRRQLRKLIGLNAPVAAVAFSPDSDRFVSASADGTLRLWDGETGEPLGRPLVGHTAEVTSVAFNLDGDRIVSGGVDKTVRLWDAKTGQPVGEPLKGHTDAVSGVAFSRDGDRIVSGSADKTLRLWDAKAGQPIGEPFQGHEGGVTGVAFSPNSNRVVSASDDHTLRIWNAGSAAMIGAPLDKHTDEVTCVTFGPYGKLIASGSRDKTVRLWDPSTGRSLGTLPVGQGVRSVTFDADGKFIASGGDDGLVRLWDVEEGGRPSGVPLEGHRAAVTGVAFGRDKSRIVSSGADATLRLWNLDEDGSISSILTTGEVIEHSTSALSPDGSRYARVDRDGKLMIGEATEGTPIGDPFAAHHDAVTSLAFSPDGSRVLSAGADGELRLWNAGTRRLIRDLGKTTSTPVTALAFSPDGGLIASGAGDGMVQVWDTGTGLPVGTARKVLDYLRTVAFTPDGKLAISDGKILRRLNPKTGQSVGPELHGGAFAVNADGTRIALASSDGDSLSVRDANTGRAIGPMIKAQDRIESVAFSRDGRFIFAGGENLEAWDAETGQPIGAPLKNTGPSIANLAISRDDRRILSSNEFGGVDLWPGPSAWADKLCAKLTHNMSRAQWRQWVAQDIDYVVQCPQLPVPADPPGRTDSTR